MLPEGTNLLRGSIDCHVHACPHMNGRSVTVFDAVRQAAAAGQRALVLMDNFQNSSGYAALARDELAHLGVEVLGGLILQPAAGGISFEAAQIAVDYGYGPGTGARFISLPTHHTRHIALQEGRSALQAESAFHVAESGDLPDDLYQIMDLCAARGIVFDCGHVSGPEALRLTETAKARGVRHIRVHCSDHAPEIVAALATLGAYCEFSFFVLSHATQVGLTHADTEKHRIAGMTLEAQSARIRAAGARALVSSDAGISLLAPPVETFRQYLLLLRAQGFSDEDLRQMSRDRPAALFGINLDAPLSGQDPIHG
ncbi:MAG: DUF6282 family protein [Pararhodobacter sp.]